MPKENTHKPVFVVQKHDASRLHYDFRLEIGGTLVSWAVSKGLSTVPNKKHLAIRTENHLLSYADFEGTIPKGQYGAGTVEIWDKGIYEPALKDDKSMKKGLKDGGLKFNLHGKKLKGSYAMALIGEQDDQEKWIIFKLNGRHIPQPLKIPNYNKILFLDSNITKADIAGYYERIADHMLPYIKDRPLTLRRFPNGTMEEGFFNKHAPKHFPKAIKRLNVPMHSKPGKVMKMVSANRAEDLIYFVGQDTIEIHMALSKAKNLEKPDQIIFDFDPSDNDFEKVRRAALELKTMLDVMSLPSFIKTTGSSGIHVHIPIKVNLAFTEAKGLAKKIAKKLHKALPDITTLEHRINKRGNKVFIDILRNDYGMTVIAPYSLRAKEGAPIATPIKWIELKDNSIGSRSYNFKNIFRRMIEKPDPWKNFYSAPVDGSSLALLLKS